MAVSDAWNPAQYDRFRAERQQPFFDLLDLVTPAADMVAVDLGAGTGETTRLLHQRLRCKSTLGVDSSPAMLQAAREQEQKDGSLSGLRFALAHVENTADWATPAARFDLLFSNACLQWVPEHVPLFAQLAERLTSTGQLAVQMPVNNDHASHVLARELFDAAPYASYLRTARHASPVLPPESYARLLHKLGFKKQRVVVQVYGHLLDSRDDVVEWVKGSLLTEPRRLLPPELYARFEAEYRERLQARLVDERPYFYPFKRLLMWAAR